MGKAVLSTAVGAVIGFVADGPRGAFVGGAAGLYLSTAQQAAETGAGTRQEPSASTVRSSKAPVRFILGRASTGGVLSWAQEQPGDAGDGELLHLVYVLSQGAIQGVSDILLNEESISTFGDYATHEVVINPTQPNAYLLANSPGWRSDMIGRGLSYVRITLRYSAELFPSGIPSVRFVVRGRTDIYDPRSGSNGYSENTALHILWYLRNRCGVPDSEIVFETFASAANVCDEPVSNADGSAANRYFSGCVIGADEPRTQVLQKLQQACGGRLIRVGGKWMLQAGAYYGPADFTITEDMVIGAVSGTTEVGNDSAVNIINGTFTDPSQAWADTDYPEVRVTQWVEEDGGESAETLSLPYVTSPYQAQRLANLELRRRRTGGAIQVPMNFAGYNCRPGRVVNLNLPSLNITGEHIVTNWTLDSDKACVVTLSKYEAAIFENAVGQPYNPIGTINLPTGAVGSPTGLTWTPDGTAEVTQGVLSWTPPAAVVNYYQVVIRQGAEAVRAFQVPGDATQVAIQGLVSGMYTMSVSAQGAVARSGETTITVNIDGPPTPDGCTVTASIESITLTPRNVINSLNGGWYEFYFAESPDVPASSATYLGQGLTFTHNGLSFDTQYFYYVRSRNAYGFSEFLYVPAKTSGDIGQYIDAMTGKITKTQLAEDLLSDIESIESIKDKIDDLVDALAYDPEQTYVTGDIVRSGQRLYQATKDVPKGAAPPDVNYWQDVGQVVKEAGALAGQVESNTANITKLDGKVTAYAEQTNALVASITPEFTGDGDWYAGDTATFAGNITIASVAADATRAVSNEVKTVSAQVGEASAQVQVAQQAVANLDGRVSSSYRVATEITANGQRYAAGFALGIDNSGGVVQSQFLVRADTFAIINAQGDVKSSPFIVQNGAVFMNSAYIANGSIDMAKIGELRSDNYIAGQQGWIMRRDGSWEINGAVAGQGRMIINSQNITLFDANGVMRMRMGYLG